MADSTMVVLVFEDERGADLLFNEFEELLKAEAFPIDDAAVAIYKQTGEVLVKLWAHPLSENGFTPELWTFVIKTLLSGWGNHIDDWFIEQFKQVFQSGTSAFFCLLEPSANKDVIILQFRQFRGTLLYAGLTEEQKVQLKAARKEESV